MVPPHAERVLEHTEALAKAFGSTITLLRATVSAETLAGRNGRLRQTLGRRFRRLGPDAHP